MIEHDWDKYKVLHLSLNKSQMHEDQLRGKKKNLDYLFEIKLNLVHTIIFPPKEWK